MRRSLSALLASTILAGSGAAVADDAPEPSASDPAGPDAPVFRLPGDSPVFHRSSLLGALDESRLHLPSRADLATPSDLPAPPPPVAPAHPGEVIEVTGGPPGPAGTIAVDARVARTTAGALGEPFRVLALLPGVTTSVAASGYPIVRGTLPGESRFVFDGIELPMLYHLLLGTEVLHPSFLGDVELRAGGHGADQGHLLGGLVTMTPAPADDERTELRANLVELGAFRAQRLSKATSIAVAARVGTLDGAAKLYDSDTTLHYVDQQTRLVHRLGNGDVLTLTSLGAYDYVKMPPDPSIETLQLGFHRLDARWTRGEAGRQIRAGVTSELDSMRSLVEYRRDPEAPMFPGSPPLPHPRRRGSSAYGARAYADADVRLAPWLAARGGVEAHARMLDNHEPLFDLGGSNAPDLAQARAVDSEGAWASLDVRLGPVTLTPGVRADRYHADLEGATARADTTARAADVDPRLAITAELPGGAQLELAGGRYSAPPQVSVIEHAIMLGPLPASDGTGSAAGLSRGYQAQAALRAPLGAGLQGNLAAYYRDTDYAIDFGMVDKPFTTRAACAPAFASDEMARYRNVGVRAMGIEAMVRRELGRDVTGWLSYSLGKVDRDLGFITLPQDFDQRHTVSATAQWRLGAWRLGASGNVHTGRPIIYPTWTVCSDPDVPAIDVIRDPTHLRRPPATWRLDLRAERAFVVAGFRMRLSVELQNATMSDEIIDYSLGASDPSDPSTYRVAEKTWFLPLPMVGLEVDL